MKLFYIKIAYPYSTMTCGDWRSPAAAERQAVQLKNDSCYACKDAVWTIESKVVSFWKWLRNN
jgi:hypothetical protein